MLEKKGDLAGALEHFDQAAKVDVANVVFQRNAALLLCKLGRADEAIPRLRDILSIDSDDAETLQILAVAKEVAAGNLPGRDSSCTASVSRRKAPVGGCDFFDFLCSLWPESSEEHLPTSIAGVLRLCAINPLLCIDLRGASLRMTLFWGD